MFYEYNVTDFKIIDKEQDFCYWWNHQQGSIQLI